MRSFTRRAGRASVALWLPLLLVASSGLGSDDAGPSEGRMLYFGGGQPRDLVPWGELRREDFLGDTPPAHLASHAGLIGAVSCVGMRMQDDAAVVSVERLPTGEKHHVARLYRPRFTAVFDRVCSWWNPQSDDPEYLLHHEQVHFDITEAAALKLTLELRADASFKTRSRSRSDALAKLDAWVGIEVKRALNEAQERHERFDRETSDVRSRPRQREWWEQVRGEIAARAKALSAAPAGSAALRRQAPRLSWPRGPRAMDLPTYSGFRTFLRAPTQVEGEPDVTVFGVPFDIGTTNRPGARFGPEAVRAASLMLMDDDHPGLRVTPGAGLRVIDRGDLEIVTGYLEASLEAIEKQVDEIQSHTIAIGGDHTISLPLLRSLRKRSDVPLSLVHFDAHVDTWDDNFGGPLGHGTPFHHALREDLIDPQSSVQIGIRSPVSNDLIDESRERGFTILSAEEVHLSGPVSIAERIAACVGDRPAYLTFDIDGLDPSCAPGTGTPVPGGLFTWQTQAILQRLAGMRWVGMDLVEIAPAYDHAQITALAGAQIAWTYLGLLSLRRRRA